MDGSGPVRMVNQRQLFDLEITKIEGVEENWKKLMSGKYSTDSFVPVYNPSQSKNAPSHNEHPYHTRPKGPIKGKETPLLISQSTRL